ncbi:MAG: HAMP domain-containing protein [Nitrospirae bacterium]|nr:HAMP domain-containing protein [Nitrospirota bacterium]
MKFFDSITLRLSVYIALIITLTAAATGWVIMREELNEHEDELKKQGNYLAEFISQQVEEPLLYEERYRIYSLLQAPMEGKESLVVYAEVYDIKGETIVTAYKNEKYRSMSPPHNVEALKNLKEIDEQTIYHISVPINASTFEIIGFLRLGITKEFFLAAYLKVKRDLYLLSAIIISIGTMLGLLMARRIMQPLLLLHKGVRKVGAGDVGFEMPVTGIGEIKDLTLSFNMMSRKLKELIDDIRSAQENLVRTEKLYAVGEFSAGVAHEIKNPLTSIKMLMDTAKYKKQALTERDIDVIVEEINRIDNIVRQFLAFARPEKTEKADVNINNVLEEIIAITTPKMERSSIRFGKAFSRDIEQIKGSHDTLKQAFLNIVLNAIHAMDGGGMLNISTSVCSGSVSVVINDNGAGISAENLQRVFDPFFTTKENGTGMGLALTYNIVKDHSGEIEIDSAPGIGTTVKVTFPAGNINSSAMSEGEA